MKIASVCPLIWVLGWCRRNRSFQGKTALYAAQQRSFTIRTYSY